MRQSSWVTYWWGICNRYWMCKWGIAEVHMHTPPAWGTLATAGMRRAMCIWSCSAHARAANMDGCSVEWASGNAWPLRPGPGPNLWGHGWHHGGKMGRVTLGWGVPILLPRHPGCRRCSPTSCCHTGFLSREVHRCSANFFVHTVMPN